MRANSSMALLSADLQGMSAVFFGFGAEQQTMILEALPEFA